MVIKVGIWLRDPASWPDPLNTSGWESPRKVKTYNGKWLDLIKASCFWWWGVEAVDSSFPGKRNDLDKDDDVLREGTEGVNCRESGDRVGIAEV